MIIIIGEIAKFFSNQVTFSDVLVVLINNIYNCLATSILLAFFFGLFAFIANTMTANVSKKEIYSNTICVTIIGFFIEGFIILIFCMICCTISPLLFIMGGTGIIQFIIGIVYYLSLTSFFSICIFKNQKY